MSSQFQLLKQPRFRPFFLTQMFGPLNVNAFKTAFITLLTFRAGTMTTLDPRMLATMLPAVFVLPFFLFSATCGQLADRHDRARLALFSKRFEFTIALIAGAGFLLSNFWLLVAALFLSGAQTTQFAPVKYAYLPQHLEEHELTGGNGLVEASTFVCILAGQIAGAWLASTGNAGLIALTLLALSGAGWLSARNIPASPPPDPDLRVSWNPAVATAAILRVARDDRNLWWLLLAIAWFWFYGATMLAQFPVYTKGVLGGSEQVYILLLCVFSVGVGVGSLVCEKLSRGRIEAGLVTVGALAMALPGFDLYLATPAAALIHDGNAAGFLQHGPHWRMLLDIALIGAGGGLYVVPLYALMQARCAARHTARVISASNILNAGLMFLSSLISLALLRAGLDIPQIFLALALATLVVGAMLVRRMPAFGVRFLALMRGRAQHRLDEAQ